MIQVWKYPLEVSDKQKVLMPIDAVVLSVQVQNGVPCIWAKVDPDAPTKSLREFIMYGTGHPMRFNHGRFIGTFQMRDGMLVFHLYEAAPGGEE